MLYAAIPSKWLHNVKPVETESLEEVLRLNSEGYNIYYYPNSASNPSKWVKANEIDTFEWVFIDMDLKMGTYNSKDDFIHEIFVNIPSPSRVIDSGGGIHAYWRVVDLDAMSFLRLSRRLMRLYNTDPAVTQLKQLMRLPGTLNTKDKDNYKECVEIYTSDNSFSCEELDKLLPPITLEDEQFCQTHYNKTYAIAQDIVVNDKLPDKFGILLKNSKEAKAIWNGNVDDRSAGDYRLGHLMYAASFTRDEALSVLVNCQKALSRAPVHRISYAEQIVDKIWQYETIPTFTGLSKSVRDILSAPIETVEGTLFPCYKWLDDTVTGHRLGQVVGLIAGVGVGKTSMALNMFMGYVTQNPNYIHMFCSLEQPVEEIARRWRKMCQGDTSLYDRVHIIGNYNDDGSFRHLSLGEIKDYILQFEKQTNKKVGCVVVDHIGILKMKDQNGENQRIVDICHELKPFALETKTLFVIQSQVNREKAGIGDLEINKDGAYGSMMFESYLDFLLSIWQPLKRVYKDGAPLVTAYKFCKIRAKNEKRDKLREDVCYKRVYEPDTEHFRDLTQDEEKSFSFFLKKATEKRKQDRKTELVEYVSLGAKK